ncbi:MAG: APC family permease [Syntrophomonadaceae bacterium]|nr:APC family permease [Syntrophomonadaceae bacterium]
MEQRPQGLTGLKRYPVKTSAVVFILYCLVAAGAFGIEEMIPAGGPGLTLTLLLVFAFIWAWPISNMIAELSSLLPGEGGVYLWPREAFGEFWGFQAGWWSTLSIYITNSVYVSLVVGYLGHFIPMTDGTSFLLKAAMIVIFTVINLFGIREVGRVSTVLSLLVMAAFAVVAVTGLVNWQHNPMQPFLAVSADNMLPGIGACICICIWMYSGYECISNVAGELEDPQVIPRALLLVMPLIALTYILPTLAGLASLGDWELWAVDGGFGTVSYFDVVTRYLGNGWGVLFLIVAILSQCSIFNSFLAAGSRGFFVLASDHLFPPALMRVSRRRGVPWVGILSLAVVSLFLAQYDFTTLVMAEVVFLLALYIMIPVTLIKLRQKYPAAERAGRFVMPGGKTGLIFFTGLPFIIAVLALLMNGADYFLIGLFATGTGPIFYFFFKRRYGGLSRIDPERYPRDARTGLAVGDGARYAAYCLITGAFALLGRVFLQWYEGARGPAYYLNEYGAGLFSSFDGMMSALLWGGLLLLALGASLFFGVRKQDREVRKGF